jgi:hypothetical protein
MSRRLQELAIGIIKACELSRVMDASAKSLCLSDSFSKVKARCAEADTTNTAVAIKTTDAGSSRYTNLHRASITSFVKP